jgi:hypothetical protein
MKETGTMDLFMLEKHLRLVDYLLRGACDNGMRVFRWAYQIAMIRAWTNHCSGSFSLVTAIQLASSAGPLVDIQVQTYKEQLIDMEANTASLKDHGIVMYKLM